MDSKLENKLDKIQEHIHSIDTTLAAQHESLKIHIKRTELLETRMEKVEKDSNMMQGMLKILLSTAIIGAILKIFLK